MPSNRQKSISQGDDSKSNFIFKLSKMLLISGEFLDKRQKKKEIALRTIKYEIMNVKIYYLSLITHH